MSASDRPANEVTGSDFNLPVEDLKPQSVDEAAAEHVKGGLQITKTVDAASPLLFQNTATSHTK